jgi:light-independent protochlorophyllide reductase subunit B
MFREDLEFADGAAPSHLGSSGAGMRAEPVEVAPIAETSTAASWTVEAEQELKKIPFFVRGKARRNTEKFALERGVHSITLETLYDAKAYLRS